MGIPDPERPFTQRLGYGILKRRRTGLYGNHLCAQQAHTIYIEGLSNGILLPHKNHTFHPHKRGSRGCGDTVLSGSGLGNQTTLAHLLRKQRLPQHVVDLMRAGVVKILPLEINFGTIQVFRHLLRVVESGWSARILIKKLCEFPVKLWIVFITLIFFFQFNHRIHQCFRYILTSVNTKTPFLSLHHSSFLSDSGCKCRYFHSFPP